VAAYRAGWGGLHGAREPEPSWWRIIERAKGGSGAREPEPSWRRLIERVGSGSLAQASPSRLGGGL
jgi:hypothetical protein